MLCLRFPGERLCSLRSKTCEQGFSCSGTTSHAPESKRSRSTEPSETLTSLRLHRSCLLGSHRIPDIGGGTRFKNELKILGDLVLEDIATAPELEEEFLKQCYSTSPMLSEYALVSREILEARYSALPSLEAEVSVAPAHGASGVSPDLQTDVLAGSIARRPLILLGDVGVGKSMFIRHFVRVDAREVMERSIVLSIDFGREPALADDFKFLCDGEVR